MTPGEARGRDDVPAYGIPPHSEPNEKAVLGGCLLSEVVLGSLLDDGLSPEHFYRDRHAQLFAAMVALREAGTPVDPLILVEHLRGAGTLEALGGAAWVDGLTADCPAVGNVREYARRVRDAAARRDLLAASQDLVVGAHGQRAPSEVATDVAERLNTGRTQHSSARRVTLMPASSFRSESVRWLWKHRIPLRGLTVLAGEKGLGKSISTNAMLPAALTRGTLEGELEGNPVDVVVASAEDDWRAVVKPRLVAHGADLDRVHAVNVVDEQGAAMLTLPNDIPRLVEQVVGLREAGRTVAMLVIDPIGAFLDAATDSHRDASVRRALAPLAQMADALDLAVLVVAHLNKDDSKRVLMRVTGSGAFINASRSVLGFARHPEDPDGEQGSQRVIVHAASNWGAYAPTLAARVESRDVPVDDGSTADTAYLVLEGEVDVSVEDLQRGPATDAYGADDVEESVVAALADGTRPSREVKEEVSEQLGVSPKTVQRAAMRLRDREELVVTKLGWPAHTTWTLPVGTPTVGTSPNSPRVPTVVPTVETPVVAGSNSSNGSSGDTAPVTVPTLTGAPGTCACGALLTKHGETRLVCFSCHAEQEVA